MLHSTDFYGETSGGEITCIQTLETPVPVDVNIKAAERMGRLHDALKASELFEEPLPIADFSEALFVHPVRALHQLARHARLTVPTPCAHPWSLLLPPKKPVPPEPALRLGKVR
jgi:hypothetical protein